MSKFSLEDFILAYDPLDCCACSRLGVDPDLLRSSLLDFLREMIPQAREEDDGYEPIASLDDLVEWAGNERELADCGTIWRQFQDNARDGNQEAPPNA
jgi:hypothetical protein